MNPNELNQLYLHCEIDPPKKFHQKFRSEINYVLDPSIKFIKANIAHKVAFLASQVAVRNFRFGELIPPI